uniref:Uncharacterized protein n=1 Tax=Aegilops tauschii subsp. strangulata TaxID=200361 RepID=A0A453E4R3_AEGTS
MIHHCLGSELKSSSHGYYCKAELLQLGCCFFLLREQSVKVLSCFLLNW